MNLNRLNKIALNASIKAHNEGGNNNLLINFKELNIENLGYFMHFMMLSSAMSSYMIDVNPFDQPGVELYKKYMKENNL